MIKLIAKEILFCKACDCIYSGENKPYILSCGNTICHNCVVKFTRVTIDKFDQSCHFDYSHHHILEDVPVNYLYLDIVQNFKRNFLSQESLREEQLEEYFKCGEDFVNSCRTNTLRINSDNLNNLSCNEIECSFLHSMDHVSKRQINGYNETKTDAYTYKGYYLNGLMHGNGEYLSEDFSFKGSFYRDLPRGKGKLLYKNVFGENILYEGDFLGFKTGEGTILYPNGDMFEGKWRNLVKEDFGEYFYNNGDYYKGGFRNDVYEGEGELYLKHERKKIKGTFLGGKENGEIFIHFDNSARPMKMLYNKGILITILEL